MPNPRNPAFLRGASDYPWLDQNGNPTMDPGTTTTTTTPTTTDTTTPAPATTATTGQPATGQPATDQTTTTTTPTSTAQGAATSGGQAAPSVGAPSGQLNTGQQGPQPVAGQAGSQGMYTPDQATASAAAAVQQANLNVASAYQQIQDRQKDVDAATATSVADPAKLQAATTALNAAYAQLSQAEDSLSTANTTYATSLDKFTDPQALAQADQAKAAAAEAKARTALLTDDTPGGQRALNAAQAGLASAQAASAQADADAKKLTAGPQRDALEGQAAQSQAQAAQINLLIGTKDNPGPLIQKAQAEVGTQLATTDQLQSQSRLNDATAARQLADGRLSDAQAAVGQAQVAAGLPAAQAAQAQATAQQTLEAIRQKQLGPAYGLQQQIDAINQIASRVWGPGGSGDPADANQFLQQYVSATLGGTTISDAAKAAAQQQGVNYGTTMAGTNALQAAQASRANAFAGFGGNVLGTLEQMNMYAPKGSTGMADAFSGVMNAMANRIAPQGFGPASIPQAPQLPPFLQAFAAGHQAGTQQAQAQGGGGQAAPTVNINVNGQSAGTSAAPVAAPVAGAAPAPPTTPLGAFNPQISTAAMNQLGFQDTPQGRAAMAQIFGPGNGPVAAGTTTTNPAAMPGAGPGGAQSSPAQTTPQQAFDQGLANAPQMPNYLQGLVNPMSMIQSARNAGLLGANTGGLLTPGLAGSFVQ